MFDMTNYIPRYFKVKLKNGKVLDVEPPKLKVLKKITKLSTVNEEMTDQVFENMIMATSMALSKNKQNYKVETNWLEDNHNIDELQSLLINYFNWVDEIETTKN